MITATLSSVKEWGSSESLFDPVSVVAGPAYGIFIFRVLINEKLVER